MMIIEKHEDRTGQVKSWSTVDRMYYTPPKKKVEYVTCDNQETMLQRMMVDSPVAFAELLIKALEDPHTPEGVLSRLFKAMEDVGGCKVLRFS